MKKFKSITLLTSIALSFALIGCSSSTDDTASQTEPDTSSAQTEPVAESADKIVIFQSKVEIIDALNQLAEDYQKETGVEVEVWSTNGDQYFNENKTKIANGQGPTVFSLQPGAEVEQLSNYLADLSDLSFVGNLAESTLSKVDGNVVGIPYTVEGFGVLYNQSLIDSSKITSTDEFVTMLQEQKANGINGFGLSQEDYFLIGHIMNTPFAVQPNPDEFLAKLEAQEVTMAETPAFQEFAEIMVAVRDNSYNPLEYNYEKEMGDFATSKTASVHQGNWAYGMLTSYDLGFEPAFMPLPIVNNDKLAVSVPTAWMVNSQVPEAEIQAGKEFLEWLYTSETGKHYLYDEFGFIPMISGDVSPNLDPLSANVQQFVQEGKTIPWTMTAWPAGSVSVYFAPVAQEFFTTSMSGDEFLIKLDIAFAEAVASTKK